MSTAQSSPAYKVVIFDRSMVDITGLVCDLWKVLVRFTLGFVDSLRFDHVVRLWRQEPKIRPILVSCFMLNMTYFALMAVIEVALGFLDVDQTQPSAAVASGNKWYWYPLLCWWLLWFTYQISWAIPMFATSFLRSNRWYSDLTDLVPPPNSPLRPIAVASDSSSSHFILQLSESLSYMLQLMFLKIATSALTAIPYTGWYLSAVLQCLLASFYAFESHWTRSHPKQSNVLFIAFIERDWAYFLGFGVLLTALTIYLPVFMSLALYAAILPIFIVVAARPDASAWRTSSIPKYRVLPHAIKYFDLGRQAADLITIWGKNLYYYLLIPRKPATTTPSAPATTNKK